MFLKIAPTSVESMLQAFRAGDVTQLKKDAHRLKSSAGSLGAMRFSALCAQIESSSAIEILSELVGQLQTELSDVKQALIKEMERLP